MYHPYSRLWLPWLVSSTLMIAAAPGFRSALLSPLARWGQRSVIATAAGCGVLFVAAAVSGRPPFWMPASIESRAAMREAAARVVGNAGPGESIFVVGHSDPALWYHLRNRLQGAFTSSSLDVLDGRSKAEKFVVLGPLSQQDASLQQEFKRREKRLELIAEFPIHLSRVALLDLHSPAELAANPEQRTQNVKLYRVLRWQ